MTTIELTRFTVTEDKVPELLAARPAMLKDFTEDRTGFLGARLIRLPNNEWLDIVEWTDPAAHTTSRTKGPNRPGIARFFAAIDTLISTEEGTTTDPST
ncbi:antibiotic biosynthesis monooxygenase [Sphaerisporangium aureirubrum]|uniref:Antibiotic biosynthesis monooxygenase n=1 Tax=Sphaerisporangium aureirubrum TaxID=1544736 RepID=A0ABW1NP73_9ACTN